MSDVIWHWTDGDIGIYTKRFDVANKAMKEGFSVEPVILIYPSPRFFKLVDVYEIVTSLGRDGEIWQSNQHFLKTWEK